MVGGEQRQRDCITKTEGEIARRKEWLTISNDTESFDKWELKGFIGLKNKIKSFGDLRRTVSFDWVRSYLMTETRVESSSLQMPVPPGAYSDPSPTRFELSSFLTSLHSLYFVLSVSF